MSKEQLGSINNEGTLKKFKDYLNEMLQKEQETVTVVAKMNQKSIDKMNTTQLMNLINAMKESRAKVQTIKQIMKKYQEMQDADS